MQKKIKKARVAILVSDKLDFKTKAILRDKQGHFIIVKGSTQKEDTNFVKIYAPNVESPKYVKQILTNKKGDINSSIAIEEDFNTPMTSMYISSRQKANKKTVALDDTLD